MREQELVAPNESFRVFGGWSRNGRRIAFASTERDGIDFDIYVIDVPADTTTPSAAPRRVHQGTGGLYVAAWRPDGKALLLSQARGEADNDVYHLDLESTFGDRRFDSERISSANFAESNVRGMCPEFSHSLGQKRTS